MENIDALTDYQLAEYIGDALADLEVARAWGKVPMASQGCVPGRSSNEAVHSSLKKVSIGYMTWILRFGLDDKRRRAFDVLERIYNLCESTESFVDQGDILQALNSASNAAAEYYEYLATSEAGKLQGHIEDSKEKSRIKANKANQNKKSKMDLRRQQVRQLYAMALTEKPGWSLKQIIEVKIIPKLSSEIPGKTYSTIRKDIEHLELKK